MQTKVHEKTIFENLIPKQNQLEIIVKKEEKNEKTEFEKNLEQCLFKLSLKKTKPVVFLLSKLLGCYHDLDFSAEELFRSKIPKIFKTMSSLIKELKNPDIEFTKIQLESILNHITEKVLNEVLILFSHLFLNSVFKSSFSITKFTWKNCL